MAKASSLVRIIPTHYKKKRKKKKNTKTGWPKNASLGDSSWSQDVIHRPRAGQRPSLEAPKS